MRPRERNSEPRQPRSSSELKFNDYREGGVQFHPPFYFSRQEKKELRDKKSGCGFFPVNVTWNIDFPVRWDRMQDTFEGIYFRERKPRNENYQ